MAKRVLNSKRFYQLINRLDFLAKEILPRPNITGTYNNVEKDLIRSYIVLSHAEIESYFEDVVKKKVTVTFELWKSRGISSNCVKSMLVFVGRELNLDKTSEVNTELRLQKVFNYFLTENIEKNHGIKEKNLLKLLLPAGIKFSDIDSTWLSEMNSYGSIRGNIAHASGLVSTIYDPRDLKLKMNNKIIPEIRKIDMSIKLLN